MGFLLGLFHLPGKQTSWLDLQQFCGITSERCLYLGYSSGSEERQKYQKAVHPVFSVQISLTTTFELEQSRRALKSERSWPASF